MEVYFALEAIKMVTGNKETFQFPIRLLGMIIISMKTKAKISKDHWTKGMKSKLLMVTTIVL